MRRTRRTRGEHQAGEQRDDVTELIRGEPCATWAALPWRWRVLIIARDRCSCSTLWWRHARRGAHGRVHRGAHGLPPRGHTVLEEKGETHTAQRRARHRPDDLAGDLGA